VLPITNTSRKMTEC